jgi:hypothetical protein
LNNDERGNYVGAACSRRMQQREAEPTPFLSLGSGSKYGCFVKAAYRMGRGSRWGVSSTAFLSCGGGPKYGLFVTEGRKLRVSIFVMSGRIEVRSLPKIRESNVRQFCQRGADRCTAVLSFCSTRVLGHRAGRGLTKGRAFPHPEYGRALALLKH